MRKPLRNSIAGIAFVPSPPTGLGPRTDNVLMPLGVPPSPLNGPGYFAGEFPLNVGAMVQAYQVPMFTSPGYPVTAQMQLQGLSLSNPNPYATYGVATGIAPTVSANENVIPTGS